MDTATRLRQRLEDTFVGKPWYGTPISVLVGQCNWQTAYTRPAQSPHSIAHILLHMTGWTQEVTTRMQGHTAADPPLGDWPEPAQPSEQNWHEMVINLDEANSNLVKAIDAFDETRWDELINDRRGVWEPVPTYRELIQGFIEHQIYHAGQIALLNKMDHA